MEVTIILLLHPTVHKAYVCTIRIYCIGDIHGRVDLLLQLLVAVARDSAGYGGSKKIIYLGDYIDRGDESKAVIDWLLNHPLPGFEAIYLRGNHEQTMLDFLQQAEVGPGWLAWGGKATLVSYGVKVARMPTHPEGVSILPQVLRTNHCPWAHSNRKAGDVLQSHWH